ncbi:DegT/DnrJ/EryC1/StrS aminotransferase family protein [Methanophagales archaeon]|nr:MAG: DegT/DnrJ/EryC1/StrS aminotransferase family protein [Methanophagales archaeon]
MIPHSSPTIEEDDIEAVEKSLRDKKLASGEISSLFANKLKTFFNSKKAILTPSGTMAIVHALNLLNLGKKDEVIIPAYVCDSVAKAVIMSGATPMVVDVNRDDYNISYEDTLEKISNRTKAIILPHIFGNPVQDIKAFLKLGIPIIEDIAQSIGGLFEGKRLGSFGDMSICSFYATKMITTGEGGALIVNSNRLIEEIDVEKNYFKMPDFQSSLGLNQLKKIDVLINRRRYIAKQYIEELETVPNIRIPNLNEDCIYYRFIIEVEKDLDKSIKQLNTLGIKVERYTDIVLNYLKLDINDYPNTKKAVHRVLSIPIYPSLSDENVQYIIKCIKNVIGGVR